MLSHKAHESYNSINHLASSSSQHSSTSFNTYLLAGSLTPALCTYVSGSSNATSHVSAGRPGKRRQVCVSNFEPHGSSANMSPPAAAGAMSESLTSSSSMSVESGAASLAVRAAAAAATPLRAVMLSARQRSACISSRLAVVKSGNTEPRDLRKASTSYFQLGNFGSSDFFTTNP